MSLRCNTLSLKPIEGQISFQFVENHMELGQSYLRNHSVLNIRKEKEKRERNIATYRPFAFR